ncbi:MAG: hypothetical protein GX750_01005 [Clostridia bacterium]|nr:hypothetical protein [Clostridia bacterium]
MSEHSLPAAGRRFAIVLAIVICAIVLQYYYPEPEQRMINYPGRVATEDNSRHQELVKLVTNYLKCGHSVVLENTIDPNRLTEIMAEHPELELQQIDGDTVLMLTNEGFCPDHEEKRYLGIRGEYLAIFRGSAGNGELESITQIRVDRLPEEWQSKLQEGKLVFEDEISLMEALDSLDEYQS